MHAMVLIVLRGGCLKSKKLMKKERSEFANDNALDGDCYEINTLLWCS